MQGVQNVRMTGYEFFGMIFMQIKEKLLNFDHDFYIKVADFLNYSQFSSHGSHQTETLNESLLRSNVFLTLQLYDGYVYCNMTIKANVQMEGGWFYDAKNDKNAKAAILQSIRGCMTETKLMVL